MPLTPLQRKAAFVAKATERDETLAAAAKALGVTWHHLNEGLLGVRPLSLDVQKAVATYTGLSLERLNFPKKTGRRAVAV